MSFVGPYDSTTNYAVGNGVLWQGAGWVSLIPDNHGNTPSLSPAAWAMFSAPGAPGPTGATGATGAAGPAGANGLPGSTGAVGATGAQGVQGDPARRAPPVSPARQECRASRRAGTNRHNGGRRIQPDRKACKEWPGAAGAQGIPGTTGSTGPQGATGAAGAAGPSVPQAPTGRTG